MALFGGQYLGLFGSLGKLTGGEYEDEYGVPHYTKGTYPCEQIFGRKMLLVVVCDSSFRFF